jgi:glucose-6-phosphate isomerase
MHACFLDKAISLSVILPYIERLSAFTAWYSQMLSESLGKNNKGITPIRAIGPLDQHSQLQLFLDGPQDKLITVISQKQHSAKCVIKNPFSATQSFSYLEGKTLADILHAEHQATIETLHENQRPLRHFAIQTLDEETLGALMMHIMLEVICLSQLMKIDPFNQPAVEQGKIRTRHLLAQKEDII